MDHRAAEGGGVMFLEMDNVEGTRSFVNVRYIDSFWVDSEGFVHVAAVGYDTGSWKIKTSLNDFISLLKRIGVEVVEVRDA
jgi:hypothetical protein